MTAGRVGKPHGLDGSFYVDTPRHVLPEGVSIVISGRSYAIARRAGTDERPLIRLEGVADPRGLRGQLMLVEDELADDEWLASDLIGLSVPGIGTVSEVIDSPSCSLLQLTDGTLIPFITDAVRSVDLEAGEIEVNQEFLG